MADAGKQGGAEIDDLLRQGREAMAERRYQVARDRFDAALRAAPDDPRVQSLAVMAEFWRRLAREGDGFGPLPDAPARLKPKAPTGPVPGPAPTQVSPPRSPKTPPPPAKAPPTTK